MWSAEAGTQGGATARARSRWAASLAPPLPALAFLGRAGELAVLGGALRSLAGGAGFRHLVLGEQGAGKSRLVAEALSGDGVRGIVVHTARCSELDADRPFGALIDALNLRPGAPSRDLAALGERIASATRRSSDAEQRREVALRVAALIRHMSHAAPVVLVLEDVQWADRHTVMVLGEIAESCHDAALGLVLTRRMVPLRAPVNDLFQEGCPPFDTIDLEALDADVMALLAQTFLGAPPGRRLQELVDSVGGNPGMLLALLAGWRHLGVLHATGDGVEMDTEALPRELRPLILSRVSRLSDRCQDLLTVAAVFEHPFGVAMLAALAHRSVIDVLTDLREALAARLLLEIDGVLSFRHRIVRQVIYEAMPVTVRAELHRQIAEALHADHGSPALVGHHELRAAELGGDSNVIPWPGDAAERAALRWELLTATERRVALLVARGMSNKQAGANLQVSARTVETHLAHIFAKLGINSRVELAAAMGRAGFGAAITTPPAPGGDRPILLVGRRRDRQPRSATPLE